MGHLVRSPALQNRAAGAEHGDGGVAPQQFLPHVQEVLGLVPKQHKVGMVACTCNPSTQKQDGQKFKIIIGYVRNWMLARIYETLSKT